MKIVVISSKGGVGKSTISMQLVAPYLYEKNSKNPIKFYEFDDENEDSLSYGGSELTIRKLIEVENEVLFMNMLEILSTDENVCIDIGGNKSTTMALNALAKTGAIYEVDMAIIPLLDGEQDAINASKIYQQLKNINPEIKIVFALNKVRQLKYLKYQFDNFFGDVRGIFNDINSLIHILEKDEVENYIALLDDEVIKYSRKFGTTIYEIANQNRDFKMEMQKVNDIKEKKLLGFKSFVYEDSKRYLKEVLQPAFEKLDKIMGENNDI